MIQLPQGVRAALFLYYVSDSTGIEIKVSLSGMAKIDEAALSGLDPKGMIEKGELPDVAADDWRVMTDDEIKDYVEREDDDK